MPGTYQTWSVVFGEQPTAAKWNILGTNDAAMNDGGGLGDDIIVNRHIGTNAVSGDQLGKMIGCILRRQATQSIANATDVTINWDNEDYDPDGLNASGVFTAPSTGIYTFGGCGIFAGSSGGTYRMIKLYVDDSFYNNHSNSSDPSHPYMPFSFTVKLTAGQTVEIKVRHDYGSALNLYNAWVGIWRLGAESSS